MRRRATAQARYPTNATYLFRTRPTEQDQARKAISCIARSTSLFALLSLLTTCMMFNINRLWTDTPSSSSSNQTELCFFVLPASQQLYPPFTALCSLQSASCSLCIFSRLYTASISYIPPALAFISSFSLIDSPLVSTLINPLSPIVLIILRNCTHDVPSVLTLVLLTHI
jgi:hypothetical protein